MSSNVGYNLEEKGWVLPWKRDEIIKKGDNLAKKGCVTINHPGFLNIFDNFKQFCEIFSLPKRTTKTLGPRTGLK